MTLEVFDLPQEILGSLSAPFPGALLGLFAIAILLVAALMPAAPRQRLIGGAAVAAVRRCISPHNDRSIL
jgi:hypothetical protein